MIGASKDKIPAESPLKMPLKRPRGPDSEKPRKKDEPVMEKTNSPVRVPEKPETQEEIPSGEPVPAPAKKTPQPASCTTIPPNGKTWALPACLGESTRLLAIIIVLIIAGAALIFTGMLSLPYISSPATVSGSSLPQITTAPVTITVTKETLMVTTTPVATAILVPGPTQTLPAHLDIVLQVERDPRTRMISIEYMGGKGQYGVREIFVRVTRSDGEVLTGSFKPIQIGSKIELQGTEQVDRVEVIVRYNSGEEYTVIDRIFEYKVRSA